MAGCASSSSALGAAPRYPLVVAANRDEQHARPTRGAGVVADAPSVRRRARSQAGGTWLAIDRRGRFAAVTNIRDPERPIGPALARRRWSRTFSRARRLAAQLRGARGARRR